VSLDELVNNNVSNITIEKISNTERLAQLTIKIIKGIGILIVVAIVLGIIYSLVHTEAWFVGGSGQLCVVLTKSHTILRYGIMMITATIKMTDIKIIGHAPIAI
jgi:uncharacterized membrane protein YadS